MLAGPVAGTILFAMARGMPMARITEATGLRSEDLIELDTRLPEHHMPALWRLLGATFPGEALTLEMAASVPLSFFGVLAHASRYAHDLRTAIQMLVRYRMVMSTSLHIELVPGQVESELRFHHTQDEADDGYASEMGLAVNARFLRELLRVEDALLRVELAYEPMGPLSAYRAFFGTPVLPAAGRNALVLETSTLDRPLPERSPPMLQFVMAHLELVRERQIARDENADLARIRDAIGRNAQRGEYGIEALARRLATTPRTLQRRARALETSLRELIDQAREANARQLLGERRLSITEVAFVLGYSTESSFRRALKRWTGKSPLQIRLEAS